MKFTKDFFNIISDFGDEWNITSIEANHIKKEVYIDLEYGIDEYFDPQTEEEYKLYDHAPERVWRHLDVWDFKTYIRCRLPRIKNRKGEVKTIRCGWTGKT